MDLLIKNGTVVSPWFQRKMDVLIDKGKIIALGNVNNVQANRIVDATGKYVIPGGIDSHTHYETPIQGVFGGDNFYTGSVAGAFGGVTSLIDFAITPKGESPMSILENRINMALERGTIIDFSFHSCFTELTQENISEIRKIIEYGVPSFKVFMTYSKDGIMLDDGQLYAFLEEANKYNGLVGVHAENDAISQYKKNKLINNNNTKWIYHAESKPNIVEAEAIQRAIFLAKQAKSALFVFHMSTNEGISICEDAHFQGFPVYSETCPHYLTFTKEVYNQEDGIFYIMSPPLRDKKDVMALWEGFKKGVVHIVSSDHVSFTKSEKEKFLQRDEHNRIIQDFSLVPNGSPGIELRLPTLVNGVNEKKITWEELVRVNSYNASKIFGLYPKKGLIDVGFDADVVIVDPNRKVKVTNDILHMNVDYTLYEGIEFKGWPIMTILRGSVIVENGKLLGNKGTGKFISRMIDPVILNTTKWS